MGWAGACIEKLQRGETLRFRPRGNSMTPEIATGDLVEVRPLDAGEPSRSDVVLCRVDGSEYLHNVSAVQTTGSNSRSATTTAGWTACGSPSERRPPAPRRAPRSTRRRTTCHRFTNENV